MPLARLQQDWECPAAFLVSRLNRTLDDQEENPLVLVWGVGKGSQPCDARRKAVSAILNVTPERGRMHS